MGTDLLSRIKCGDTATIKSFEDFDLSMKMIKMGCSSGQKVRIVHTAPFNGPIAFEFDCSMIAMRKEEAETTIVES